MGAAPNRTRGALAQRPAPGCEKSICVEHKLPGLRHPAPAAWTDRGQGWASSGVMTVLLLTSKGTCAFKVASLNRKPPPGCTIKFPFQLQQRVSKLCLPRRCTPLHSGYCSITAVSLRGQMSKEMAYNININIYHKHIT